MKKNRRETNPESGATVKDSHDKKIVEVVDREFDVRPAPGFEVTDPATGKPLPENGATVKDSPYWRRRLQDGLVIDISDR